MEQFDENVSVDTTHQIVHSSHTTQKPTNIGDAIHSVGSNRELTAKK